MEHVQDSLTALRTAAARLSEAAAAAESGVPTQVIGQLEVALRELSVTCYTLGAPLADDRGSHEDRRRTLAALHSVGAAVGSAARVCRVERRALAAADDGAVAGAVS